MKLKLHKHENFFKLGLTIFLTFVACAVFWIVFSNIKGFYSLIMDFFSIIASILFGCLFAYLMNPIMEFCIRLLHKLLDRSKKLSQKRVDTICKTGGILAALLVFLLCFVALIFMIVPNLIDSIEELLQPSKLEYYYSKVNAWTNNFLEDTEFGVWFQENLDDFWGILLNALKKIDISAIISGLTNSVYSIVMTVFDILVGIIAAVYILVFKKSLCAQTKKIIVAVFNERHANRLFEIGRRTNRIFSGYVIGKIIDAIFVGVVTYIAMLIMKLPYAPLIAVLVGVTNVIPFFGPFLGAIPSALLLLIEKPIDAVYFIIFILVLQMIDGNIVENRILGEKLGISDFWVLVSVLVFGGIFGFAGMLLGVPVFAVIYTLISDSVNNRLKRKRYPTQTEQYYSLQCVSELPIEPTASYSFTSADPAYDVNIDDEDDYDDYDDE